MLTISGFVLKVLLYLHFTSNYFQFLHGNWVYLCRMRMDMDLNLQCIGNMDIICCTVNIL